MSKRKKVWSDPVGSKLIAEGLKEIFKWSWGTLLLPLYAFIKSLFSDTSFSSAWKQTWKSIGNFFISDFQINILTIILIVCTYIVLTLIIKFFTSRSSSHAIKSFNNANIWGADISWKWEKEKDGDWQIKYGEYKMVCPVCFHNLKHDDINGQYHLACRNIGCNFRSSVYHYEAPSNVVILADMSIHYFHNALTSTVEAEIRKRKTRK